MTPSEHENQIADPSTNERARGEIKCSAVVVLSGGPEPDTRVVAALPEHSYVIAADSGFNHGRLLGLRVDELIGDFDSLAPGSLATAETEGVRIDRHPVAKDATDLELALHRAVQVASAQPSLTNAPIAVVVGEGWTDRLDHLFAQLGLFASPAFAAHPLVAFVGSSFFAVVHPTRVLTVDTATGTTVSLVATGGPVEGVTTEGLRFPLTGEELSPYSTRSISNEVASSPFTVGVDQGTLVVIVPNALNRNFSSTFTDRT